VSGDRSQILGRSVMGKDSWLVRKRCSAFNRCNWRISTSWFAIDYLSFRCKILLLISLSPGGRSK
jgi:hypothetical protein